jgi:ferredoxin
VTQPSRPARVWIDQDLCTGDGLCVQYAPEVFEFDIDGLAYVRDADGNLLTSPGARTDVPAHLRLEVLDAAKECPGECIYVESDEAAEPGVSPSGGSPEGAAPPPARVA